MKITITTIKELHHLLENCDDLTQAKVYIDQLEKLAKTEVYYVSYSTYHYAQGKYNEAKKIIEEGLRKFSFSFSLHYNALIVLYELAEYESMFTHLGYCYKFASPGMKEELEHLQKKIVDSLVYEKGISVDFVKQHFEKTNKIYNETDGRSYPINAQGENLVRKVLNKGEKYENLTNLYKTVCVQNVLNEYMYYTKFERFEGKQDIQYKFEFDGPTLLPISLINQSTTLELEFNGENHQVNNTKLIVNQYHYFNFEKGVLSITADQPIFIGKPIPMKDFETKPYKLVLHLFIDGLSGEHLQNIGPEQHLSRVLNSFESKYENRNCYATADWTYPSNAGTFTATDFTKHGQFHPSFNHDFSIKQKSLVEVIKDNGYFTTLISGCWRTTPIQGYGKSFDRVVFKNSMGGFGVSEMMEEVIDHLEAFKEKNHYLWLTIPDLHDIPDELYFSPLSQSKIDFRDKLNSNMGITSVQTYYNESKLKRYSDELKRIDLHLGVLFKYLQSVYKEEEMLIIIHSDHGQGYLTKDSEPFLSAYRTKVPFYLLGGNIETKVSDEIMSNLDIYPTILNLLNIDYDTTNLDGKVLEDFGGEKRVFAITETIHPNQTFKIAFNYADYVVYFETTEFVDDFGKVDFEQFDIVIESKGKQLSEKEKEDIICYTEEWILKNRLQLQK